MIKDLFIGMEIRETLVYHAVIRMFDIKTLTY